jgi:FecR protein
MKTTSFSCAILVITAGFVSAAPLTESTVSEVIKDVSVLRDSTATPAKLNDVVRAPDRVRTGPESRAELTAPDQTITRIGANTVFSFESEGRVLNLESGSLLFHSPKGAGGGTIKTGGATAAVLGTTIIVVATADGGFKLIVLEGKARATLPTGKTITLKAGQLVFVLPGGKGFSRVLTINLGRLVGGSLLVNGFSHDVSSLSLIQAAIGKQRDDIAEGRAEDTGMSPDAFFGWEQTTYDGLNSIDHGSYQTGVHPPVDPSRLFRSGQGNQRGGFGGTGIVPVSGGLPN